MRVMAILLVDINCSCLRFTTLYRYLCVGRTDVVWHYASNDLSIQNLVKSRKCRQFDPQPTAQGIVYSRKPIINLYFYRLELFINN